MDYLFRKSDSSITNLGGSVSKVRLPEQINGDVVLCGRDKRPLDLGDYVLIDSIEITEPITSGKKRGDTTVVVDADKLTVTVTQTAINQTTGELWAAIRSERNYKLTQSDWRGMSDAPTMSDAWTDYRQALRDVGGQSDPKKITWPSEPS